MEGPGYYDVVEEVSVESYQHHCIPYPFVLYGCLWVGGERWWVSVYVCGRFKESVGSNRRF